MKLTKQGVRDLNGIKPRKRPPGVQPVNRAHLELAQFAIAQHRAMLLQAWRDLFPQSPIIAGEAALDETGKAIAHVLEGFRSKETRGG